MSGVALEPLVSGLTWEADPDAATQIASPGRTKALWLRSAECPHRHAFFKTVRPGRAEPFEMYSMGMERVAYALASLLGLPVPPVFLESYEGEPGALITKLSEIRDGRNAGACPMLRTTIENQADWPLMVLFDVWIGNVDRHAANLAYQAMPQGTRVQSAVRSRTWLIDHGFAGLFPPAKFGPGYRGKDPATVILGERGQMDPDVEKRLLGVMPPEYRKAFTHSGSRDALLDRIRMIEDDPIDGVLADIPAEYMSSKQAALTAEMLKRRRDGIGELAAGY